VPDPSIDLDAFHTRGFADVNGAVDAGVVAAMRGRLWSVLAEQRIRCDQPGTWPTGSAGNLRAVRRGEAGPDATPAVRHALDAVFGAVPRAVPCHWGQALVAFPEPVVWSVPRTAWHCDFPYWFSADEIWGALVLLFLDDVDTHGGATLAIEGSPAFVRRAVSGRGDLGTARPAAVQADVLGCVDVLRTASDVELRRGVRAPDGSPLRVVELTGRAGDVVVCHPWLLHCASANTGTRPRLQRAARVQRRFGPGR
jgi:ectoine hydroxylase-related dioxygenase (phytanoyl-CoA dioxygenase family)